MIRKLFTAVFTGLFLLILAAAVLPFVVPPEKVAAFALDAARKATGREISLKTARIQIFPDIGLRVTDLSVGNPAWSREREMLRVAEADLGVALRPLLRGELRITRLVLNAPVVRLEKSAEGRANWDFSKPEGGDEKGAGAASSGGGTLALPQVLRLSDAALSYIDRGTGTRADLSRLNLSASSAGGDFALQSDAVYNGRPAKIDARIDDAQKLLNGRETKVEIKAEGGPITAASLSGRVKLDEKTASLADATVTLAGVTGKGSVSLSRAKRPVVTAQLSFDDALDLGALFASSATAAEKTGEKAAPAKKQSFDFSALRDFDADVALRAEKLMYKGLEASPAALTAKLEGGRLRVTVPQTKAAGGDLSAEATLNAVAVPQVSFSLKVEGAAARPVLSAFAGFSKLSGTVEGELSLSAQGRDAEEMTAALSGNGALTFRNGAFEGIDLVNIATLVQRKLAQLDIGGGKTEFVEMGGTFTVQNGVASNKDFRMKGPLVQATGAGSVDLPRKSVRYRLTPVLTASSGAAQAGGLAVPVDIVGPFSDISVRPDYAAVLRDALANPGGIEGAVKNVRDLGKNIGAQAAPVLKDLREDPAGAIKNLLGGILPGQ